jgi:hypothetical protein
MNSGDEIVVNKLRAKANELQQKLEEMRKTLEHIEGVLALYQPTSAQNVSSVDLNVSADTSADIPSSRLKGLSHEAAAIAIAKYNGGIVRTQEAKRLMIKAGIMSPTRNATNMAHNAINRSDKFERINPGEYRLKEAKQHQDVTFNPAQGAFADLKPIQ